MVNTTLSKKCISVTTFHIEKQSAFRGFKRVTFLYYNGDNRKEDTPLQIELAPLGSTTVFSRQTSSNDIERIRTRTSAADEGELFRPRRTIIERGAHLLAFPREWMIKLTSVSRLLRELAALSRSKTVCSRDETRDR